MRRATCVAAALLLLAGEAQAEPVTGNELYRGCQDDASFCLGYIVGATEMYNTMLLLTVPGAMPICLPEGATRGQLIDVVKQYLRDHPEHRHEWAIALLANAVRAAFPC